MGTAPSIAEPGAPLLGGDVVDIGGCAHVHVHLADIAEIAGRGGEIERGGEWPARTRLEGIAGVLAPGETAAGLDGDLDEAPAIDAVHGVDRERGVAVAEVERCAEHPGDPG